MLLLCILRPASCGGSESALFAISAWFFSCPVCTSRRANTIWILLSETTHPHIASVNPALWNLDLKTHKSIRKIGLRIARAQAWVLEHVPVLVRKRREGVGRKRRTTSPAV
ncbi:hypothetical protein K439DRAFT_313445 [Ramaria rubella]|nr:hypothetical protein K439DRAFT_313445 [Ramaria rubella]